MRRPTRDRRSSHAQEDVPAPTRVQQASAAAVKRGGGRHRRAGCGERAAVEQEPSNPFAFKKQSSTYKSEPGLAAPCMRMLAADGGGRARQAEEAAPFTITHTHTHTHTHIVQCLPLKENANAKRAQCRSAAAPPQSASVEEAEREEEGDDALGFAASPATPLAHGIRGGGRGSASRGAGGRARCSMAEGGGVAVGGGRG